MSEEKIETEKTEEQPIKPISLRDIAENPFLLPGASPSNKIKILKRKIIKDKIKKKGLHGFEKKMVRKMYFSLK